MRQKYFLDSIHFHSKRKKEKNINQESFSIYIKEIKIIEPLCTHLQRYIRNCRLDRFMIKCLKRKKTTQHFHLINVDLQLNS